MDYLPISRLRLAIAAASILTGVGLMYGLGHIYRFIAPSTLQAFSFAGLAIAALTVADAFEGLARKAWFVLAIGAAFVWTGQALHPIYALVTNSWLMVQGHKAAGFTPVASLGYGWSFLLYLSHRYAKSYQAGLVVAALPVLGLLATPSLIRDRAKRDRASNCGPWQAQWMKGAELRYLKSVPSGLPLGVKDGVMLRYQPSTGWRGGHHLAIAGTRAGKGVSVVIPAIIDHDGPVVCLDVKGENFAVTRRWRAQQGRRVVVLNPFGVIEPAKDGYNPLDYVRRDFLVRDIDVIAEGLVRPETGVGGHFAEMACQVIAAAIEVVITQNPPAGRNLNVVADLLLSDKLEERLRDWASQPELFGRRPAQAAAALLSAGENERGGVQTTMKKAFEWARSDEMRAFLTKSTASFDDLLDDKIDIFIAVPLDQLGAQEVFMRLIINIVLGTVVRQDGRRVAEKRILVVLDEFVRLGRMEKLLDVANVAAGSGIEALFITQDKGQIEGVYGANDTNSLLGSCVTSRIFGLGRLESHTAIWAANALGDRTVITRSVQAPTKFGEGQRISTSEQKQKLMTADEILGMQADEMLCLIGSKPPLKVRVIVSHAHRAYRAKLDPNPTRRA